MIALALLILLLPTYESQKEITIENMDSGAELHINNLGKVMIKLVKGKTIWTHYPFKEELQNLDIRTNFLLKNNSKISYTIRECTNFIKILNITR